MTMSQTPTQPHSTLLSTFYTWLGSRTFYHWPSSLTESAGGILLFLVPLAIILLATGHRALAVFVLGTAGNLLWGLKLDPNDAGKKSEWPDGLIREAWILGLTLIAHFAFKL